MAARLCHPRKGRHVRHHPGGRARRSPTAAPRSRVRARALPQCGRTQAKAARYHPALQALARGAPRRPESADADGGQRIEPRRPPGALGSLSSGMQAQAAEAQGQMQHTPGRRGDGRAFVAIQESPEAAADCTVMGLGELGRRDEGQHAQEEVGPSRSAEV